VHFGVTFSFFLPNFVEIDHTVAKIPREKISSEMYKFDWPIALNMA